MESQCPSKAQKIGIHSMPDPRLFVTFTIKTARKEKHLYVPAPIHQSRGKYASYSWEDNAFTAVASANVVKSSLETIASFQGPWCNIWMLIHHLHSRDVHPRLSGLLHSRGIFPPLSISYQGEAGTSERPSPVQDLSYSVDIPLICAD